MLLSYFDKDPWGQKLKIGQKAGELNFYKGCLVNARSL